MLGNAADYDLRIFIVDLAAFVADAANPAVAFGNPAGDLAAAARTIFHGLDIGTGTAVGWRFEEFLMMNSDFCGAGSENRTRTLFPEPDFESGASTSSATPALKESSV